MRLRSPMLRVAEALDRVRNRGPAWSFQWARTDDAEREHVPFTRGIDEALALAEGERLADVGTGAGYFALRAARTVGPTGHVLAADRQWNACLHVWVQKERRQLSNLSVRWVHPYRPRLDAGLDAVLLVNVFAFRRGREARGAELLQRLASALRPGGRLVIAADAVHTSAWRAPFGRGRRADDLDGAAIAAIAPPFITVARHAQLEGGPAEIGKAPGFILRFDRR